MYIEDLKGDFYDLLTGNWILLLVGYDVDSLCACKILQYLFQCDNIMHTVVPVYGKTNLKEAFRNHASQKQFVIMINCGAAIDVVEFLEPGDDVIFFICDTHRPVDVYNVYNNFQVRLLMKQDNEEIPSYDDLFRDSDDEDEEEGESSRLTEAVILKRRERRLWEENRHKLLFDYTQFSYHGLSSALSMFELAWKMSKDTNELLWWAIVGITEQYLFGKIERENYILNAASLQNHVSRYNHVTNSTTETKSFMKISFDKELNLALYRHWTLFESITHSRYTACKFKLWTFKGQKRVLEFLAEIGIPLPECKQQFMAMDAEYRTNIGNWIEDMSEKYKLDQIVFGSFVSQFGYKGKFCAMDVVFSINALLESIDKEKDHTDNFHRALSALSSSQINILRRGIELGKIQLMAIFNQVQTFINMNYIISAGPFLYAVVEDGTSDIRHFRNPGCLCMLAHFLLQAHVCSSKSRKSRSLPLVLVVQEQQDNESDKHIVIGIPPLISEGSPKNFFGKAFEQAAERSKSQVLHDFFESSVVYIHSSDRSKFFDALVAILS